jgi:hypothetical protein
VASQQRREGRRLSALAHTAYLRAVGPMLALIELFGANSDSEWGQR